MQTLDKVKEAIDSQGREGVAEARVTKRVNRKRAVGVIAGAIPALIGGGVLLGGLRHGGLDGAVSEGFKGITSVARNSDGEWDMPLFNPSGSVKDGQVSIGFDREVATPDLDNSAAVTDFDATRNCELHGIIQTDDDPLKFIGRAIGNRSLKAEENFYNSLSPEVQESLSQTFGSPNLIGQTVVIDIC